MSAIPSSNIIKRTLKIDGLTCVSCENRIEHKLQNTTGVIHAKVSYSGGTAAITFDSHLVTLEGIAEIIERMDYKVKSAGCSIGSKTGIMKTLIVAIAIFVLYMIVSRLGGLGISLSGIALPSASGGSKSGNTAVVKDGVQYVTTGLPMDDIIETSAVTSAAAASEASSTSPTDVNTVAVTEYTIPTNDIAVARIVDDIQYVEITLDQNGIFPAVIVMQSGIETEWVINAIQPSGGNSVLLFPQYYTQFDVREGENEISFIPEGDFDFSTLDASFFGYVKVVDDLKGVDINAIRQEVDQYTPDFWNASQDSASQPSCH